MDKAPYFIFKGTSCDDNVERWFEFYNDESGKYEKRSLLDMDEVFSEFVIIKDKQIQSFVSNVNYKKNYV